MGFDLTYCISELFRTWQWIVYYISAVMLYYVRKRSGDTYDNVYSPARAICVRLFIYLLDICYCINVLVYLTKVLITYARNFPIE